MTRRTIEIAAFCAAVLLAAFSFQAWLASHDEQQRLQSTLSTQKQVIDAADARERARDASLKDTLAQIAKLKNSSQTPNEILRELPKYLSLPEPITLQSSTAPVALPTPLAKTSTMRKGTRFPLLRSLNVVNPDHPPSPDESLSSQTQLPSEKVCAAPDLSVCQSELGSANEPRPAASASIPNAAPDSKSPKQDVRSLANPTDHFKPSDVDFRSKLRRQAAQFTSTRAAQDQTVQVFPPAKSISALEPTQTPEVAQGPNTAQDDHPDKSTHAAQKDPAVDLVEAPRSGPDVCKTATGCSLQVPSADLKPLYNYVLDCRSCQAQLAAANQNLADDAIKIAALTHERDAAITASKGGTFWRRLRSNALWFAAGATTAFVLSHHSATAKP